MSWCECPKCHREFTSLTAFDKHQDVDYRRPHADIVRCQGPASVGLVIGRGGRWGHPGDADSRARAEKMRAERKAGR